MSGVMGPVIKTCRPVSYHRYKFIVSRNSVKRLFMQTILLSHEDVATIAKKLYENGICEIVEREGNIGKMVIIDVETGDYEVDKNGLQASNRLSKRRPDARQFGLRISYNVAASLGGIMERVSE